MYCKLGGGLFGILMVLVFVVYIVYFLVDKLVLVLGFVVGFVVNMIGFGFFGVVVGGLIVGYLMCWVKNYLCFSSKFNGFLIFYFYLVFGMLGVGSLMLFVVGEFVVWINNLFIVWLNGLLGSNVLLLGVIFGFMCFFDFGGLVNKVVYVFCLGVMVNGVYGLYVIFVFVKMVLVFIVIVFMMFVLCLFKEFEIEIGKFIWLLGLVGIIEGVILMVIEDLLWVIGLFVLGFMVMGVIVGVMNIGFLIFGVGIFLFFLFYDNGVGGVMVVIGWFGVVLVGVVILIVIFLMWWCYVVKYGNYLIDGVML